MKIFDFILRVLLAGLLIACLLLVGITLAQLRDNSIQNKRILQLNNVLSMENRKISLENRKINLENQKMSLATQHLLEKIINNQKEEN